MTKEEIESIRSEHISTDIGYVKDVCLACSYWTTEDSNYVPYPCDLIKILDAWDADKKFKCSW